MFSSFIKNETVKCAFILSLGLVPFMMMQPANKAEAQVNAPAPATVTVSPQAAPSDSSRSNELSPDTFSSTPRAPMLNVTDTQPAPIAMQNFKMTREECRNLSKSAGYSQAEFSARSIQCDKKYSADTFDKNHPAEPADSSM